MMEFWWPIEGSAQAVLGNFIRVRVTEIYEGSGETLIYFQALSSYPSSTVYVFTEPKFREKVVTISSYGPYPHGENIMSDPKPTLKPRLAELPGRTPMIMNLGRSHLLWIVNRQLDAEGKPNLPPETEVTFEVPGGGDYSSCSVSLDDREQVLTFRWVQ
jgi:hypothetical protein